MALEQKLHLKLSQKLIMTPSLQQAIKLLQLSKLELQEVLNQELLENPLLEESAEETKQEEAEAETAEAKTETEEPKKEEAKKEEEKEKDSFDEIDYDAYFQDYIEYGCNPRGMGEEHDEFPIENTLTRPPNLTDHLTWQLSMSDASPIVKEIGAFIIGNIDEDGYLRASNEEIAASGNFEMADVEKAVLAIQSLDPIGVGARDLRECLLLQLQFLEIDVPYVEEIVRDHWDEFMQRKFVQISKALGIDMKTLEGIVEVIKHLDPKPGRKYSNERAIYVEPDVYVQKVGDEYVIVLNEDGMPKLRINGSYRAMLNSMDSKSDGETVNYIKDKIRSAVWLIKSLDQRQPLSDSKIMKILNDEGINIARRTVAKYRDELNIPSSTDRKQVF